jgi:hypothetical protein
MSLRKNILLPAIFIIVVACAKPPAAPTTPTIIPTPFAGALYVDPNISLGEISPLDYGSNHGPWIALSVEGLQPAYDSGLTVLRFPGGSWGDHNNVNTLQIDQFMSFIEKVGATAMINVRLLGGTPEQAAEMVRYVNVEMKYDVVYWGIGNEPTLYNDELENRGDSYDVDRFNQEWRAFAEAMKKVDADIQLVGPEVHQFSFDVTGTTNYSITTAQDRNGKYWMDEFLKTNGDLVDIVSIHRYPFPVSSVAGPPSVEELQANAREWDQIIIRLRELIHENTGRDLPIAVTEFNSAYNKSVGVETSPDSHYNAIWLGDVLGRMIKNGVFMANHWMLTSKGGYGGWGLVGQNGVYPSYYTYQIYDMFGDELIYSSSDQSNLSIYAAKRKDGALTLMVINLSLEEQTKSLRIAGHATPQGEAWLFDPSHNVENKGIVSLEEAVTFPAQSITLFIIE